MTASELRNARVSARIPGSAVSTNAGLSRGRLSEIERGTVIARDDELTRIEQAINKLATARRKVAEVAAEHGWPMPA